MMGRVRFWIVAVCAGMVLGIPVGALAQVPDRRVAPEGAPIDRENGTRSQPSAPRDGVTTDQRAETQRLTPLQRLLKNGVPERAAERARLRDNLYALLATAPNETAAKKIIGALQQVWQTSGSATIDLLLSRAGKAQKAKKVEVSLKLLDEVVALAPDFAEGWNRRAYLHYRQRNYRAAAGDLRRTLALDPNHYRALGGLGTILMESGDEIGALKVYQRLISIHPNSETGRKAHDELKKKVEGRGI